MKCNLTKRIKTANGLRYCPVVYSANGRVKPNAVLVDGGEEKHSEGAYYIDWREGTQRRRLCVGKDAQDASTAQLKKETELSARNYGIPVTPEGKNGRRSLATAVVNYLEEIRLAKNPKPTQPTRRRFATFKSLARRHA